MTNNPYATSFSLKTLDHLGINLYGYAPAVLAELIANAHDAGATRIDVTISPGKIVVQDDGNGMSLIDINTKYLRFGYEKRRDTTTLLLSDGNRTIQRHVMGRKGIGKISALSIAREIEVQTVHGDERNGFIIDLDIIRRLQGNNDTEYFPTPLPAERISIDRGTRIELRQITNDVTGLDDDLRESLARIFPETGPAAFFDIFVNGVPLTIDDRSWFKKIQFLWYFGEESSKFIPYCPGVEKSFQVDNVVDIARGYTISGWLATTFKPSDVSIDQKIVPVYAQNKMIQRDLLYDYKNYKVSSSYLIGEVYAPFMDVDTEPDIILSDRQRINPNDPRYVLLRQLVVKQVEEIDKVWDRLRKSSPSHRSRKKQKDILPDPPEQKDRPSTDPSTPTDEASPSLPGDPAVEQQSDGGENERDNGASPGDNQPTTEEDTQDTKEERAPNKNRPVPSNEAQAAFLSIRAAVEGSALDQKFKSIVIYDLEQAKFAYYAQVHKASVVMMGAVVEGLMKGTLYRTDILDYIINDTNPPSVINKIPGGLHHPDYNDRSVLRQKIAEVLSFEDCRNVIQHYLPHLQHLGVPEIQRFRNAIHPWNCISEPQLYSTYGPQRALAHLMALTMITEAMLSWTP